MKSQDLRPGIAVRMDGQLFLVTEFQHVTPGNLRAFIQIKMRNVKTGSYLEKRYRSSEEVESAFLDRRDLEFLYAERDGGVFMDSQTYDQISISKDVLGEALSYLKPNTVVTGLLTDTTVITIELPKVVDLEVVETPPGIKDATKTNQLKEATMETGLKVKVPPFIKQGERIRISTETGEYLSRVTGD
ncbi:MAG: elongation factor P [Phycisphaeraceae bacterium]|nr:elongation factor P [Phycisphaeraceae bacterium]